MFCYEAIIIIFVLLKTCFKIKEGKVSTLPHLYELSLDEGESLLLVEIAVAIIVEVVPDVFHTVTNDFMDRDFLNTVVFAIGTLFI